jgi:nucleotide-binding universal stress UspA family protein
MKTATSRAVVVVTARPPADEDDATARDSAPLLDEAAKLLREQGVPATTQALEGDPAEALIESGCCAAPSRKRLVAHAPCDVLVVR